MHAYLVIIQWFYCEKKIRMLRRALKHQEKCINTTFFPCGNYFCGFVGRLDFGIGFVCCAVPSVFLRHCLVLSLFFLSWQVVSLLENNQVHGNGCSFHFRVCCFFSALSEDNISKPSSPPFPRPLSPPSLVFVSLFSPLKSHLTRNITNV